MSGKALEFYMDRTDPETLYDPIHGRGFPVYRTEAGAGLEEYLEPGDHSYREFAGARYRAVQDPETDLEYETLPDRFWLAPRGVELWLHSADVRGMSSAAWKAPYISTGDAREVMRELRRERDETREKDMSQMLRDPEREPVPDPGQVNLDDFQRDLRVRYGRDTEIESSHSATT